MPPLVREQVRPYGQAGSSSMTTSAAEVSHGLPPPSTITISAPLSSSALSTLSSVSEPQPNPRTMPALAAATAREKACLIFNESAINLEERILAEEALARDRANLGKIFAIGRFEDEMAHANEVEEGLEVAHDVKSMILKGQMSNLTNWNDHVDYEKTSRSPVCHREEHEAIRRDFDCALVSQMPWTKAQCPGLLKNCMRIPWSFVGKSIIPASILVLQGKRNDEE